MDSENIQRKAPTFEGAVSPHLLSGVNIAHKGAPSPYLPWPQGRLPMGSPTGGAPSLFFSGGSAFFCCSYVMSISAATYLDRRSDKRDNVKMDYVYRAAREGWSEQSTG